MHTDLRTSLITNLDNKVPVSMMKQGTSSSTTSMVQSQTTGAHGEDEEVKNDVTQDEVTALIQPLKKRQR